MKSRYLAAAGIVALIVLLRAYLSTAGSTPATQPPLEDLTQLSTLKTEFNRDVSKLRVIILLSPSCPYCLKGGSDIQRVLDRHQDRALAVFVIWQPILSTDWGKPRTGPLSRISDRRARQLWDAEHLVASALRQSFERRNPQPACCDENGVWWDLMAAFPPGAEWNERFPEPLLFDGTVADVAPAFDSLLAK